MLLEVGADSSHVQTLEDLRPLMKVGIPGLGLAVAEPMAVEAISFQQGGKPGLPSPVTIRWKRFRELRHAL